MTAMQKWGSWILSGLPGALLLASAGAKFAKPAGFEQGFTNFGWPIALATPIGVVELLCTVLYFIPRTSVLGAILLTGYLGGAIATHVRIGDAWIGPFLFGAMLWGGLYLRDPRIRALIPLKS